MPLENDILATSRNTNPEKNFKNFLSQSKIVLRCFSLGPNFNVATAAVFPSAVALSVAEHGVHC